MQLSPLKYGAAPKVLSTLARLRAFLVSELKDKSSPTEGLKDVEEFLVVVAEEKKDLPASGGARRQRSSF